MSSQPPLTDLPYRFGVGMMLFNRDGNIFMAQRIDTRAEAWQMPQGGIDEGEDARAAAMRELEEEIGTTNAEIIAESAEWYVYDLPEELASKLWGGKYRGQKQKWFLLRFLGEDTEINLATAHPEFHSWQWVDVAEVLKLIVPFKRTMYEAIVAEFMPHIVRLK